MPGKVSARRRKEGQGAIEFLTTYGYVFVVIAIAFVILFMYFSLPKNIILTQCSFYSGFNCKDAVLSAKSGGGATLVLLVENNQPGTVSISGFNAIIGGAASTVGSCSQNTLQSGQSAYCTATFAFTPSPSAVYSGSYNLSASYCTPQGGSSTCTPTVQASTYAGSVRIQAGVPITVTTTAAAGSTTISSQTVLTTSVATTSIPGVSTISSTRPILSIPENPVPYYGNTVVTATAYAITDTVQISDNGQVVASGSGQATYNFQGDEIPGSSNTITATDTTNGQSVSQTITITKATPSLALNDCGGQVTPYSCTTTGVISTPFNQLTGNLYLSQNGGSASLLGSSSNSVSNTLSILGNFIYTYNTIGNGNYLSASLTAAWNGVTPLVSSASPGSITMDQAQSQTISASNSGGTSPYSNTWTASTASGACPAPSVGSGSSWAFVPTSGSKNCAFTFTDTVKDSSSPQQTKTATTGQITVDPLLAVSVSPSGTTYMDYGQSKTISALASGGTGTYTYSWSLNSKTPSGCPAPSIGSGSSWTFTPGSYYQTCSYAFTSSVTDTASTPNTNSSVGTGAIAVNPDMVVTVDPSSPASVAAGSSIPIVAHVSYGTAGYTYQWSDSLVGTVPGYSTCTASNPDVSGWTSSSETFSPSSTYLGCEYTFTVTVTDAVGAQASRSSATVSVISTTLATSGASSMQSSSSPSVTLQSGNAYFCAAGINFYCISSASWYPADKSDNAGCSSAGAPGNDTTVGHQLSNVCSMSYEYGYTDTSPISGASVTYSSSYTYSVAATQATAISCNTQDLFSYSIPSQNTETLISIACGDSTCGSVTLPSGCSPLTSENLINAGISGQLGTSYIATCGSQAAGTYDVYINGDTDCGPSGTVVISAAAYNFHPTTAPTTATTTSVISGSTFIGTTEVTMADGTQKMIKDIKPGDVILSYDTVNRKVVPNVVQKVIAYTLPTEYVINGVVKTDEYEVFYTPDGWVAAKDLKAGDRILNPIDGSWTAVQSISTVNGTFYMYDIIGTSLNDFVVQGGYLGDVVTT